ncbi:MAG TPA: G1 family glutamic endopeptidase [Pseudonocardiaceae bacterium]|jgi:hypothetical protein|nr:G1 family glutamic endopeptidase [Pseudonocardiaceae bacterium]
MTRSTRGRAALAALVLLGGLPSSAAVAAQSAAPVGQLSGPSLPGALSGPKLAPAKATGTSPNWVGYAATGGGFTSVESTWIEPTVDCTKGDGSVVFWVGLDGWGSNAVEQTGTEAQCAGGTASYRAWWETFPVNSVTPYADRIEPGDVLYANVASTGGQSYDLYLADQTQGWVENNPVTASSAATDASAEIVAETPGIGDNAYTGLPDFLTAQFTGAEMNGQPLTAGNPVGISMVRNGSTLATVSDLVGGTDFTVNWQGNS